MQIALKCHCVALQFARLLTISLSARIEGAFSDQKIKASTETQGQR